MTFFFIVLLITFLLISISIVYFYLVCGISPMPTSRQVKKLMLQLLSKHGSGRNVYDLGSGWGTLIFAISARFPDYRVTGYERSTFPFLCSWFLSLLIGKNNCRVKYEDFFNISLAKTDIVVCYLCTSLMTRLKEKFENELKPGALVISNTFAIQGWQPIETITAKDFYHSKVYIYRKE